MKAAFIQTEPKFGEIKYNVDRAVAKIKKLDAGLIVLPELFSTGYQFRSRAEVIRLSEDAVKGYSAVNLAQIAKEKKCYIVAGIAERRGTRAYNSAIMLGPSGLVGIYRKAHLFWGEKKIFSRGDTDFKVFKAGDVRVGIMICFDWIFPEAARTLALRGADVIAQPSNLVLPYCPAAMVTRSIENRVYSITANRVGSEERIKGERLRFIGRSQIVAPNGDVLVSAPGSSERTGAADIDVNRARNKRITPVNDIFKDRRADLYKQK